MVRKTRGCVGGSLLFLLVTLFANPVSADESSTHGEVYDNLWPSNVEQALERVSAEEQHASASDQSVLAGVRANLAATLALYESPDEPLPPPPMVDRVPTARVYLAADKQEEPRERRRGDERSRRDVESEDDDAGEESSAESAERQREEMISRFQEMRRRMEGSPGRRQGNESREPATPHPRIVNALQTQQEQLEQLASRIEGLELRLRELQFDRSEVAIETSPEETRDRIRIETERSERRMAEVRRLAEKARRNAMNERRADLIRRQAQLTQAQVAAQIELQQARQKVQMGEMEAQRKAQELERIEQATTELRREMSRLSDEQRDVDEVRRRVRE